MNFGELSGHVDLPICLQRSRISDAERPPKADIHHEPPNKRAYRQRLETLLKAAKDQNSDVKEFKTKMKVIRDAYLEAKGAKELVAEETHQESATLALFLNATCDYHSSTGHARLSESGEDEDEEEPPVGLFLDQLDLMVKRVGLF